MRLAAVLVITLVTLDALVAGCSSSPDHVVKSDELVDTWQRTASAPTTSATEIKFTQALMFHMTRFDGSIAEGTFAVADPLILLYPTIPADTVWCIPRGHFSGDSQDKLTFDTFDPTKCATTPMGPGVMSPLEGLYNLKPATP